MVSSHFDIIVIGGGVIGTAVARELSRKVGGRRKIGLVEKESSLGYHTSGRNSGVLHSGFNQKPGSLKARFCVEGNRRLRSYCLEKGIPIQKCGTLVVATQESERAVLREIERRGEANGVPGMSIVDARGLSQFEPHARGVEALHSPTGSIVDSRGIVLSFARDAEEGGARVLLATEVLGIRRGGGRITLVTSAGNLTCGLLFNAAGLYADRIARQLGHARGYSIVPFRGQYFRLRGERAGLVRSMIYPAPNLEFPFLGVHFTRRVDGGVILGPNAVMSGGRESYTSSEFNIGEIVQAISFPGLLKAALNRRFRSMALDEMITAWSRGRFLRLANRLVPEVRAEDLAPDIAGIRAQLMTLRGELVDDFVVEWGEDSVHILNSVSPGMTSSMPFAEFVVRDAIGKGYL